MFKDFIQSIYEKVYIINFEKCSQIPCLTSEELKVLENGMSRLVKNGFVIQMMSWKNLKIYF
ncbi:Uncharacterised protein [Streptococcus pneumoniae]|uniref:Uncharacterized protein n=2 Tax=Streptococcus pneumoniae TaxID=1313 RepID=A0A0H2ZN47_STRP2|nr:hypothetical protein SPD_1045 [Streptococcus pneumoniae D39]EDK80263.1 hypothetical protein CGSSp23BS72_09105 [Streptococcus pneumoniae SP23-BS72]EDT51508.1 conserved hypothetical protein [Streptococcus pneumoniae CDC1873-00]EGI85269.1 hypothetical protein SPAR68_1222 [Streptococcus pneumoniae GA41301]EGJ14706.1 hypothetical protein SPAR69_1144 [Streptococcus pneumoniae GA41317]EGJ15723.1 hypothetical protein SPAR93_1249 [Streptococcus pneumoniae GA47368]EHD44465.1 tagatose 1,6-diphosphate